MNSIIKLILSLLTLAVLAWAVWQGYLLLRKEQLGLDANTQSLVIIIAILLLICTAMLGAAIRSGARSIAQGQHLQRKLDLYKGFVFIWYTLRKEGDTQQAKLDLEIQEIKASLVLQASHLVL